MLKKQFFFFMGAPVTQNQWVSYCELGEKGCSDKKNPAEIQRAECSIKQLGVCSSSGISD
ncbi:hypothetical protein L4D76_03070 [Photobacterium sagamiensis]|uniref:hypothetical protein n=1 Tax=Photobacterium sagamiensis TaxID=2910241 RepID=UPI003D0C02E4